MNIITLLWWSLGRGNPAVPSRWQATSTITRRAVGGRAGRAASRHMRTLLGSSSTSLASRFDRRLELITLPLS